MQTILHPDHKPARRENWRTTTGVARGALGDEQAVVTRVLEGDEAAFATLLRRHHRQMVRLAGCYVEGRDAAERIARDAWVLALDRLETFDGSNSLKVWLAKILAGQVATRRIDPSEWAESRSFQSSAVNTTAPEVELGARRIGQRAIDALPPLQRRVLVLRDVDRWSAREASDLLGIGLAEQRRLLHAARTEVCAAMETYRAIAELDEVVQ